MEQSTRNSSPRRPFGFPKTARLLRTADYQKVYQQGKRRNLGWVVVFLLRTGQPESRVGMTVPRRLGPAVDRNRIKRKLREAVRRHYGELGPGWDIILHPRHEALKLPDTEIEKTLSRLFRGCAGQASDPEAN